MHGGDVVKDKEKGVSVSEKMREKYGWCSSFLTLPVALSEQSACPNDYVISSLLSCLFVLRFEPSAYLQQCDLEGFHIAGH